VHVYRAERGNTEDSELMAIMELRHRAARLRRCVLLPVLVGTAASGFIGSFAIGIIGLIPFLLFAVPVGTIGWFAYWFARRWMRKTWIEEFSGKRGVTRSDLAKHAARFA